jgi:hypothetical protein
MLVFPNRNPDSGVSFVSYGMLIGNLVYFVDVKGFDGNCFVLRQTLEQLRNRLRPSLVNMEAAFVRNFGTNVPNCVALCPVRQ